MTAFRLGIAAIVLLGALAMGTCVHRLHVQEAALGLSGAPVPGEVQR